MKKFPLSIKPFGEKAVLVEWPNEIQETILQDILRFVDSFSKKYPTEWELVPAYNSITMVWSSSSAMDFDMAKATIMENHQSEQEQDNPKARFLWKLPVCYDVEFGIDIIETSKFLNLSMDELVAQHTSNEYLVYGIGFLPGFMYLGGLPDSLQLPRRKEPRLHVNKGSVGLAGRQTGIYPQDSPGGWNIIGNCPIPIFNANNENPCFVNVGDKIQFQSISKAEYDLRKIEREIGIYNIEKSPLDA